MTVREITLLAYFNNVARRYLRLPNAYDLMLLNEFEQIWDDIHS